LEIQNYPKKNLNLYKNKEGDVVRKINNPLNKDLNTQNEYLTLKKLQENIITNHLECIVKFGKIFKDKKKIVKQLNCESSDEGIGYDVYNC